MDGRLLRVNLCKGKSVSLLCIFINIYEMNEKVATFALWQAWLYGREAPQEEIMRKTLVCNVEILSKP